LLIRGDRAVLRSLRLRDAARLSAWNRDPTINPVAARHPSTISAERAWIRAVNAHPNDLYFALDTEAGEHIGVVSLNGVSQKDCHALASILIDRAWWSRGYGYDAMRTLLAHAFSTLRLHRVTLYVLATNERALALYRRLGFRREGVLRDNVFLDGVYHDEIVLGILRSDWHHVMRSKKRTLGTRNGLRRWAVA
jgi:RimJ/RimL family protein N-acetyltransferase